ncbi:SDR family oxidoreductase [Actinomarinicola tropica]|uniref:SDR family NAD(P)-dependent oxidoreductase n=1 Tax=Actinomarinicola tropica TaxID=2789776 RepID=A0A5Q2RJJ8_9ACTN|nr:SDR family oxidoreductase [Actinomarinicola tropica]QGG94566.1 SDR family NAD(P)-dependent oxidoreductase [Actinomarinicola tropica]
MDLAGKVVVVTGGGGGIGEAMCRAFAAEGAAGVAVADIDGAAAARVAEDVASDTTRTFGVGLDAGDEVAVQELVRRTEEELGPVDLFCANAGIMVVGGVEVPDEDWDRIIRVNLKSHIYAARAVLPGFRQRGEGYLLHTASAAGLLTQLGSAPYSVTKHAVVALAEWLSITHGDAGVRVSCLCPQAVATAMAGGAQARRPAGVEPGKGSAGADGVLEAADVARTVVEGLAAEEFLILPHPAVATYEQRRATDRERWLRGMRRAQAAMVAAWTAAGANPPGGS